MATRSLLKLFPRTYYQISSRSSKISTHIIKYQCITRSVKHSRSISQPSHSPERRRQPKRLLQIRKVSRSLQNLRETHQNNEDEQQEREVVDYEDEQDTNLSGLINLTARPMKKAEVYEEVIDETNPVFEVTDGYRKTENVYDVFGYMRNMERRKALRLYRHLQPSSLKPYGSNDNLYFPEVDKRRGRVVYPIVGTSRRTDSRRKLNDFPFTEHRSYQTDSAPDLNEMRKVTMSDSKANFNVNTKRYSTSSLRDRTIQPKASNERKAPRLSLSSHFFKKANSSSMARKKPEIKKKLEINQPYIKISTHKNLEKKKTKSREVFISCDELLSNKSKANVGERLYNTCADKSEKKKCTNYVTVKLGELQDENRKAKKCKPKLSFGKLPKLNTGNCKCQEGPSMKPGKPLSRLKKRAVVETPRKCAIPCELMNPRADVNYVVKPKKLRPIKTEDCPCIDTVLEEGSPLKRLVAKPVIEPPRICDIPCPREEAQKKVLVERKKLPPLKVGNCPCVEQESPLDVPPLKKLKKRPVVETPRKCVIPCELQNPRADANYVIKKKKLKPIVEPDDCPCIETVLEEGTPLRRLVPKPVVVPPRICDIPCPREEAQKKIVIERKKLPPLPIGNCPCVEQEAPLDVAPLKKLKKRPVVETPRKCAIPCDLQNPRADASYIIKPKKLKPIIEPEDCPCIDTVLEEGAPLKRLVPKPVVVPPRICDIPCPREEAQKKVVVERKKLPPLPVGNCPCVEQEGPLDVLPLKKLKKRPVVETPRKCAIPCELQNPRADANYVVKPKKLPVLEVPDCPCIDPEPLKEVKPLARLPRKPVKEPPKVCPNDDICDETPRADEDDWLYWKRVEVACEPEPVDKTSKRSYSTQAGSFNRVNRSYSTNIEPRNNFYRVNYDVSKLANGNEEKDEDYNHLIDIRPSTPLILTQAPIHSKDFVGLRRCKSEPLDSVNFIISKSNNDLKCTTSKSGLGKDAPESGSMMFNTINRFISTCNVLSAKKAKELQPQTPFLKEKEHFIEPFPSDEEIDRMKKKGKLLYRARQTGEDKDDCDCSEVEIVENECKEEVKVCERIPVCPKEEKELSLWEKIVNYFKARPNCPTPEEMRQMRLKEAAEKAAAKAGMCLYDPKEAEKEKELPKVITAATIKGECKK